MKIHLPSIAQCAHVWAQQTQPEGNADHRFYFRGAFIYSYRDGYPVGRIMPGHIALIWSGRYSVSTSNHTRNAERAATRNYTAFRVLNLGREGDTPGDQEAMHYRNAFVMAENIEAETKHIIAKAKRANDSRPRTDLAQGGYLATKVSEAEHYCHLFNIPVPAYLQQWSSAACLTEYDRIWAAEASARRQGRGKAGHSLAQGT